MKLLDIIKGILFPPNIKCIVCGGELYFNNKYGLCEKCNLDYNTKYCKTCGRHVGSMTTYCIECTNRSHDFDIARAPFVYEGVIRKLIYRLKYGHGAYLAENMAEFMYDTFLENFEEIDYITYVPMPEEREEQRGYNQAKEIAMAFYALSSIPVIPALVRTKYTKNLARMGRQERQESIADSIKLNEEVKIKGKKILLIDDVFTSGATTNECSKVLKKGKATFVYVLTFATSTDKIQMY